MKDISAVLPSLSSHAPTSEEAREQLSRIVSSAAFAGSDPVRNLLFYLGEQALDQPGKSTKEYEIATQVLGRKEDFDPKTDSSVRVAASRLRSKLAEYYVDVGKADGVVVNLPRGSYLLIFSYREGLVSQQQLAEPPISPSNDKVSRRSVLVSTLGGSGLAAAAFFYLGRQSATAPAAPKSLRTFWKTFVAGPGEPLLVYANPRFEGMPDSGMKLTDAQKPSTPKVLNVLTGTGEVIAVSSYTRLFDTMHTKVRVKRSQLFTWDDAPSNNLIFVGGQEQNEALARLPKLEKFNLKPYNSEPYLHRGAVVNAKPAAGEDVYYLAGEDLENGVEYSVVALTRGVSRDRRILITGGTNTYGTEAAAKFLTDPVKVDELLKKLHVTDSVPPFEALLRVKVQGGAPLEPSLVLTYLRTDSAG